jgi:hypothetical protein
MHKAPLIISGLIFLFIALVHLKRIIDPFQVKIGDYGVPEDVSYWGFGILLVLAIWNFVAAKKACCTHKK